MQLCVFFILRLLTCGPQSRHAYSCYALCRRVVTAVPSSQDCALKLTHLHLSLSLAIPLSLQSLQLWHKSSFSGMVSFTRS